MCPGVPAMSGDGISIGGGACISIGGGGGGRNGLPIHAASAGLLMHEGSSGPVGGPGGGGTKTNLAGFATTDSSLGYVRIATAGTHIDWQN
jgi:hypothetical protein